MFTKKDLQEAFVTGVTTKLASFGSRAELARKVGISPSYVSDILCRRKTGSEPVRRKIAAVLGAAYEEILEIGRRGINAEEPIPEIAVCLCFKRFSEERAICIYQSAAKTAGIAGTFFFKDDVLRRTRPPGWVEYLNREIGDTELYERANKEIETLQQP